jgi:hypothetical protein
MLVPLITWLWQHIRHRRDRSDLNRMSDYELRDIGLHRSDVGLPPPGATALTERDRFSIIG